MDTTYYPLVSFNYQTETRFRLLKDRLIKVNNNVQHERVSCYGQKDAERVEPSNLL